MLHQNPLDKLKQYVDMPSGSFDKEDVVALAKVIAKDFEDLGFAVTTYEGNTFGPRIVATIGSGAKSLMLMGHMDTVFPRNVYVPYHDNGDGTISGSGIIDMKGGIVVMLYALQNTLSQIDLQKYSIRVVLNADEEVGSPESHEIILENAKQSFAALSFEPGGQGGRITCARKGVTSVLVSCTGKAGHAGAEYTKCASAIQALCAQITKLYALRDDAREISFNAGLISGGTAENVVAPTAQCKCEFRYFDQSLQKPLMEKIAEIVSTEPVEGAHTTISFGASHPAIDINEKSQALIDKAQAIAKEMQIPLPHEKTGGAGDIAIAGLAGIGVLDGFGLVGQSMHTIKEFTVKDSVAQRITLASKMLLSVLD